MVNAWFSGSFLPSSIRLVGRSLVLRPTFPPTPFPSVTSWDEWRVWVKDGGRNEDPTEAIRSEGNVKRPNRTSDERRGRAVWGEGRLLSSLRSSRSPPFAHSARRGRVLTSLPASVVSLWPLVSRSFRHSTLPFTS